MHSNVNKHMSEYSTRSRVIQFVSVCPICDDLVVNHVMGKACRAYEWVYMKPRPDNYDFTYIYEFLFKEYHMTFPLTDFEAGMLNLINVAPSQLHPNSWAFLRCFELLCHHLNFEPTINIFTYFY